MERKGKYVYFCGFAGMNTRGPFAGSTIIVIDHRIVDLTEVRQALADDCRKAVEEGRFLPFLEGPEVTSLTLLADPASQLDDDEWAHERTASAAAYLTAQAWSAIPPAERTMIGDRLGMSNLANTLDALVKIVNSDV